MKPTLVVQCKELPWRTFILLSILFLAASRFDLFYSINGPPVITGLAEDRADDVLKTAALLGLVLWSIHSLWKHRYFSFRIQWARAALFSLYGVWCVLSLCWTGEASLTIGKLLVLLITTLVAVALAGRFSLREISILVFFSSALSNLIGLGAEIALGTFRPWDAMYRFSGLWHPNTHGLSLSLLVLSGLALWRSETRGKAWIAGITSLGFVLLLLTRSRTSVASTILIAAFTYLLLAQRKQRWACLLGLAIAAGIAAFITANGVASLPFDSVLLGRQDTEASTLTNRIPLWKDCLPYIAQHPWTGYGYGGFWTPTRITTITAPEETAWNPEMIKYVPDGSFLPDAHSLYIETTLGTGLIGTFLLTGGLLISIYILGFQTLRTGSIGSGYAFAVLTWLCLAAALEALTPQPCLPLLIGPLLLAKTAFIGDRLDRKRMPASVKTSFKTSDSLSAPEAVHV